MTVRMDINPAAFEDDSIALKYVIETIINNKVNTTEVVRVVSVDDAKNELTVIPVVKNVDAKGNAIEETNFYRIKYVRWQYGINSIMAKPSAGDVGLILVSKRDISKINSGIVDSRRKFNLADSIYIGGLCGFNQTPTQYIKFDENGIEITSPTKISVNAPTVETTATTVNATMANATISVSGTATITGGTVAVNGGSVSVSGGSVSLGSGENEKNVCLDGDPVFNGNNQQIGTVRATSTVVKAN